MIPGVIINKIIRNQDNRGWLAEFYRSDETDFKPAMTYVSETQPGVVRGPHEHRQQSDLFVFLVGDFILYLWDNRPEAENYRQLETLEVGGINPCSVIVPPGVVHAYKCTSATPGLVINMPDQLYRGQERQAEVDEIRWESDPASPFKL